ncbi:hypothetical protein CcaverHIS002_0702040 [Cutaneotrichosporon cavernicola]|uniref:Uncharacterized protein n=1 Tax=Cutaneotrichosporon cavernicola TaxID=279322 RepID=A0AA48LA35_9TREE|nr:uncharacterized protein CcaverHIS019_0702050 [Cutaneotrichosporon cavernicola]BEI86858.1 hypothetical protein CcaverHIS002_0702040 [Cutaneotrichosporon cavernicola]BEI94633.1 hypothetical protein CcaverHIS019_0702050 [Cutaneotrichosporon cavernicola]BEJ02410.1 hypothetical protein CcaverHIS631_0702050 [Cutaneotrichosporon cavernicola]BEJ10168.1 hypothetical protein CcaverHIS641_0702030 [Cutaneotrichosporon cavernicola]
MRFTLATLALASMAEAHLTLWHPSLFGFNWPDVGDAVVQHYQLNTPVNPARGMDNLTVDEWFGHNMRNCTPAKDAFLELETGKTVTFEIGCNRAHTTYRPPEWSYTTKPLLEYCCPDRGPLHTANNYGTPYNKLNVSLFGGTALAIAYESDPYKVKPEDMVVISVNYTSPWFRLVDYQIPPSLPRCPKGGCICTWNWIHTRMNREGYGSEIYNTMYKCKVTGKTSKFSFIPNPAPPEQDCAGNPDNCTPGPKQPMYMFQKDGNNLPDPEPHSETATYVSRFADGAQLDVVVGAAAHTGPSVALSVTVAISVLLFCTI